MARITWQRRARSDLRSLHDYIADDSPAQAQRMVARIQAAVEHLREFPQMGRTVPEYATPAVRELIVAPYRVVYRYQSERNVVSILMIVHGSVCRSLLTTSEQTTGTLLGVNRNGGNAACTEGDSTFLRPLPRSSFPTRVHPRSRPHPHSSVSRAPQRRRRRGRQRAYCRSRPRAGRARRPGPSPPP